MNLELKRIASGTDDTLGALYINGKFECFTLEDEKRTIKVKGETRIPAGNYQIKFREILSGKTKRYRKRYTWFTWHLHLQNVPGFKYVYIHIGNYEKDTDGCLLVGEQLLSNLSGRGAVLKSGPAFKRLYAKISEVLTRGEPVFINVN